MPSPTTTIPQTEGDIRTVSFVSLGCPKNLVDSEKMLGLLAEDGLLPISHDSDQPADAIVVNTCGFLEASKQESLSVIHEALEKKSRGEVKRVIVAGCLVQRHRAKILEWAPGVDAMIGVFDRDKIVDAVRGERSARDTLDSAPKPTYWIEANALTAAKTRGINTTGLTVQGKDGKGVGYFESDSARLRLTPRHYAYLRISEGCNQRCAFCTIPSIRGKMRSKPVERILDEVRELLADGAFEISLIGQDTTSYGDDIGCGFDRANAKHSRDFVGMGGLPMLLAKIDETVTKQVGPGGAWVRLMYAYPSTFTDEMIDALASLPNLVKYIDIPLQHASDNMLTGMRRHVRAAQQRELIEKLRERIPGMAIRTTFITGFPGETEDDHRQLLEFIDDMRFDMLGVFEYSHEDGTPAGTMEEDPALAVPPEVKARRKDEIMSLQRDIAFEQAAFLAEQFDPADPENTGVRFDVLIDEPAPDVEIAGGTGNAQVYRGRAYFQSPQIDSVTFVASNQRLSPGELVRCTVVGSDGYDLIARPSADLEKRMSLPVMR
ncbi:MAG: 30S ribosomal protein S12 methylthiotransferase RimO [Phycisphaeraceae bacterium]|nr:30S ribosomal protein S12 methylthiotransferase RimO [Phycisphaeraceae bacterium]